MDAKTNDEQWLDRDGLRSLQWTKLRRMLDEVVPANPFWARRFADAGLSADDIRAPADLLKLPLVAKTDVAADQSTHAPYGSNLTYQMTRYTRLHQTSGTTGGGMYWLDTADSWDWFARCWGVIFDAVGLRSEDRLYCAFSFGPFVGFWGAFDGGQRRGALCISGAAQSTVARLHAMLRHEITVLCCTPTYALHLAQTADDENIPIADGPLRMAIVAGEPGGSQPGVRQRIESGLGIRVVDHTGMTEIGAAAVECVENPGHVHLIESEYIAELVDSKDGSLLFSPLRDAAELTEPTEGELVLTNLGRWGSPLIRYRTGDVVRLQTGVCPCGRHYIRMVGGILGRTDDMIIIKGNNVYPSAIDSLLREFEHIAEYRCEIADREGLTSLKIEIEPVSETVDTAALCEAVRDRLRERLFFNAEICSAACGALPRFELKARRFHRILADS
jgi:phenylacetate-CoA ligase